MKFEVKFEVIENFYSDLPIIAQNVDLIYKCSNTMHLKIFACKSQEFLGNRHLLCYFYQSTTFTFAPGFVANSNIHTICGYIITAGQITQNSRHKQLELLILSVQECTITSQIFRSQSFFLFLTQCQTKAEICWKTFWQIRRSEN